MAEEKIQSLTAEEYQRIVNSYKARYDPSKSTEDYQSATAECVWIDAVKDASPLTSAEYEKIADETRASRKKKAKPRKASGKQKLSKLSAEERTAVKEVKELMKLGANKLRMLNAVAARRLAKTPRKNCAKFLCPHKAIPGEELCPRCKAHQTRI